MQAADLLVLTNFRVSGILLVLIILGALRLSPAPSCLIPGPGLIRAGE